MRLPLRRAFVLTLVVGCRGGHVTDVGLSPDELGAYESAVVQTSAAPGVALKPEEAADLEQELDARLREAKVFAHVARGNVAAQVLVRVTVEKLEVYENPLAINSPQEHAEARAAVELVDTAASRVIGRFAVEASDTDKRFHIVVEKGSARAIALRNVARATARKLRASR